MNRKEYECYDEIEDARELGLMLFENGFTPWMAETTKQTPR
jgi:hypothetical protein